MNIDWNMKANDWGQLYHPGCGCIAGNCYYNECPNGWYKEKDLTVKYTETQQNNKNKHQKTQQLKYTQLTLW